MTRLSLIPALLLCLIPMSPAQAPGPAAMDKDLVEVTIPQLQSYYASHRYTVTQVV